MSSKAVIVVNPEFQELEEEISKIPSRFMAGALLYSGRNEVRSLQLGSAKAIVKHFQKPNILKRLQYALAGTGKAKKSYIYGLYDFAQAQLSTPTPLAYILIKKGGMVVDTYFASLPCKGTQMSETAKRGLPQPLLAALSLELVKMHQAGILHGDVNLSNIFWDTAADGNIAIRFIDINRSKFKKNPSKGACAKNMMRLTHDERLLRQISEEYARLRGWDTTEYTRMVLKHLRAFQRKKTLLGRLKGKNVDFSSYPKVEI